MDSPPSPSAPGVSTVTSEGAAAVDTAAAPLRRLERWLPLLQSNTYTLPVLAPHTKNCDVACTHVSCTRRPSEGSASYVHRAMNGAGDAQVGVGGGDEKEREPEQLCKQRRE